jgi:hypothetical protein
VLRLCCVWCFATTGVPKHGSGESQKISKKKKIRSLTTLPFSAFHVLASCHHDHSARFAWFWTSATPWHPPRSRHGTLSKRARICASLVRLWVSLSFLFGLVPPRSFERHVSSEFSTQYRMRACSPNLLIAYSHIRTSLYYSSFHPLFTHSSLFSILLILFLTTHFPPRMRTHHQS